MFTKQTVFLFLIVISLLILMIGDLSSKKQDSVASTTFSREAPASDLVEKESKETETYIENTQEELFEFNTYTIAAYNGTDSSLPIYVAFEGSVYDVTEGRKFYGRDGHYNFLAGTDGTNLLKFFGGDIIKEKYQVIGIFNP